MRTSVRFVCTVALLACVLIGSTDAAFAQSSGRVVVDRATIWRADVSVVAAQVTMGNVVELTGRSDRWYEVVIPKALGGRRGETGLIAISQVELLPGSPEPPLKRLRGSAPVPDSPGPAPRSQPSSTPQRNLTNAEPHIGVRGFGQVGYATLSASRSFEAVLGESHGPTFGGGAQLRFRNGIFVQGSFERFRKTGQRVFVHEGEVFALGIPSTITIEPATVSAGFRFAMTHPAVPYVGGGVGTYRLRENTPFTEAGEEVDQRFTGYHVLGGVEFRNTRWLATAVEGRYRTVRDALGAGGASQAFDEDDLGGLQIQVKVLVGR